MTEKENTPEIIPDMRARLSRLVEEFGGTAVRQELDTLSPLQKFSMTTADGLDNWKDPMLGPEPEPRDDEYYPTYRK